MSYACEVCGTGDDKTHLETCPYAYIKELEDKLDSIRKFARDELAACGDDPWDAGAGYICKGILGILEPPK